MIGEHGVAVWSSEAWRSRALAWADSHLAAAGMERAGEPEQVSLRPWAAVLRIPTTTTEPVWFKATAPAVAFEAPLYALLAEVVPDRVLTPLAVDTERGWVLLPDGGPTLGDRLGGEQLVTALADGLPHYAHLQRALTPHADAMLEAGVADMRPEAMPQRFEEALATVPANVRDRVEPMRDTVAAWCDALASGPVAASIDHNDMHPWNILDGPRFYDWGDAVVAHPFATMLALGWIDLEPADVERLRDSYLEPFGDLAPHAELVEQLETACRVGFIARALTWHRAVAASPEEVEERWLTGPEESLTSLLGDTWLGRA